MNHESIFTCGHSDDAFAEVERLHKLFKDTFKRAMEPELYMSDQGFDRERVWGITVYWEPTAQAEADVQWLKGAVTQ